MRLIAHRGNVRGSRYDEENQPDYVGFALRKGYDVEVDVWWSTGGYLYLGHDSPCHLVPPWLLDNDRVWWHAKNVEALVALLRLGKTVFMHDSEDAALVSNGKLWHLHDALKEPTERSVLVYPKRPEYTSPLCVYAVCHDYVGYE